MARALIQTANQSAQDVALNSVISLGSVQRRFGCNCHLSGNAIELSGDGYFMVTASVTATPTATGDVTVQLYENGSPVFGAIGTDSVSTAGNTVTFPIIATVRRTCCSVDASNLTFVLTEGAGVVNNIAVRVEKA